MVMVAVEVEVMVEVEVEVEVEEEEEMRLCLCLCLCRRLCLVLRACGPTEPVRGVDWCDTMWHACGHCARHSQWCTTRRREANPQPLCPDHSRDRRACSARSTAARSSKLSRAAVRRPVRT